MIRFLPYILILFFIEILLFSFYFRMQSIGFLVIPDEETKTYIMTQIIAHDSIIFALILIFIYFSYLRFLPKFISYLLRTISILVLFLYIIDIFTLKYFVTHININDVRKYFTYAPKYILQEYDINYLHFIMGLVITSFLIIFIKKNLILLKKYHIIFLSSISMFLILNSFSKDNYVHTWVYKNFIEYNIDALKQSKSYTKEFKKNISLDDRIICQEGKVQKKNIIILMVESFASYQSNYFSGIKNWTPELDKIAKSNISIKEFYSNSFITEDAAISVLSGKLPIYSPDLKLGLGSTAFNGFYNIKNSLINHLKSKDYYTEFISSSDLEFSNTGKWAKSIGFDYIEGSRHSFYEKYKRYYFDSVEDKIFLKRILHIVKNRNKKKPYFIYATTMSSHIPFLNPENNQHSEEQTIRYVDKEIGKFYNQLKLTNFFDNGLLIITGDHHPIIPLKKEQIKKHGLHKAGTQIPLIISFGEKKKKIILEKFQHTDIYNTIKNYTSIQKCTSLWSGDFILDEVIKPEFIAYRRGDKRGIISVFNDNNVYNIQLNGDDTHIINTKESDITRTIINKINYERIKRQENSSKN